jgi:hypothetical protein
MVKNLPEMPDKNTIKALEKKLDRCRNQANNPESQIYKKRMLKELNLEDEDDGEDDLNDDDESNDHTMPSDVSMMSVNNSLHFD